MAPALLILAAVFGLLFVTRVSGARRAALLKRWPAVVFAGAAIFALTRGALWPATALAALAALSWAIWPRLAASGRRGAPRPTANNPEDAAARALLGVGPDAGEAEIRRAYRSKMAQAHPDRGGAHAEAARLTAARDRLLRKRR